MTDHYFGKALITSCDGHVKCYVLLTPTGLISDHVHDGFCVCKCNKIALRWINGFRVQFERLWMRSESRIWPLKAVRHRFIPTLQMAVEKCLKHFPSLNTNILAAHVNRYRHTCSNNYDFTDILHICCTVSVFNVFLVNKSGFVTWWW